MTSGAAMLEFLAAALLVELSPGPNMAWLVALSAREGRRAGFFAVAGITLGLAVHLILAATGVSVLLAADPPILRTLKWIGAAYMFWLAFDAWRDAHGASPARMAHAQNALRGFLNNVFNAKALLFYVAFLPPFIDASSPALPQMFGLGAMHLLISVAIHSGLVFAGGRLKAVLQPTKLVRGLFAGSIALIGIWLAFSAI